MSRLRSIPDRAKAAAGVLLLAIAVGAVACDEDGKTTPERCADPALAIYDIQADAAGQSGNPCLTPIGHSISLIAMPDIGDTTTATTGGAATGGKDGGVAGNGGVAGSGAGGATDAGAGGA